MDIPHALLDLITQERVVLVLGAGASREAVNTTGQNAPLGSELTTRIAEKFFGNKLNTSSLAYVSELAISETDLFSFQEFIASIFEPFEPTKAHLLLPFFKWASIVTTNYDLLVEKSYSKSEGIQTILPLIENGDPLEESLKNQNTVGYLKLHGCITRIRSKKCPLILTIDQYINHKIGRDRLYNRFYELAYSYTLVFIGHSLQDSDVRSLLLDIDLEHHSRPRYYIVSPDYNSSEERFWNSRRISLLKGTFNDFMCSIDRSIPHNHRQLSVSIIHHPIERHFCSHEPLSENCRDFLLNDASFVEEHQPNEKINPLDFYKGNTGGWTAIEQNLDVPRTFIDDILQDSFLLEDISKRKPLEVILIKGYAGSGKTVALHRLAWNAAKDYDCICIYLEKHKEINTGAVQEIINKSNKRVFLFIDDALTREKDIIRFLNEIKNESELLTLILSARTNEWNMASPELASFITDDYEVSNLTEDEIQILLGLLETYNALGHLEGKTQEEKIQAFQYAGSQLLVALHEATLGMPFEEILESEYENLVSLEAKRIYISVCTMNRLNIPVRAGIISRIHRIPFRDFSMRLFKPLEHVIYSEEDRTIKDFVYRARHHIIADIIFERILKNESDRFNEYYNCLSSLNLDYSSDFYIFSNFTKAKNLLSIFTNIEYIYSIFEKALELSPDDPYILQQKCLFEINRPNGDLDLATRCINRAIELLPSNAHFKNTKSQLFIKKSKLSRSTLESSKYLQSARKMAQESKDKNNKDTYNDHTLARIALMELKNVLESGKTDFETPLLQQLIKDVNSHINNGLQKNPNDTYILKIKSDLHKLLNDIPAAIDSMEKAVNNNTKLSHVFIELADYFIHKGKFEKANEIYEKYINSNRNNKLINYKYSIFLELISAPLDRIEYYLKRSFDPNDSNFDALIRYIRNLFYQGKFDQVKNNIALMYNKKQYHSSNGRIIHEIKGNYSGTIQSIKYSHIFVKEFKSGLIVYIPSSNIKSDSKNYLKKNTTVYFNLGINYRGLIGENCSMSSLSLIE
ncbi:SIR2 family protein [Akkermansia sp.]|uniref:P-loop NTPase n=1 Tax=Akkermansia sp. TaxID=1872421 RepID=UPI003AB6B159